ncbi:chitobiase/beta-hexosaminidase C-terminal domain-containing protein [Leptospira levettii]|uniref:chitobiase/beta-hexosaminidase C-terminal domain-containing protein n=1 Tax=Leptospira levettii TaxID=2023178 RepID=UPI00223D1297|nr:chitobiase/beta-hexosaminidase C-terminal domain-containing protein [Leptospira levettii]MCW7474584.1 chitobiase/beta-hexosaminidase C-terminal domain-containing protein [Leptospira levettii]
MQIYRHFLSLIFLLLFTSNCFLFLPNGGKQTDFSVFGFLLGLLGGSTSSSSQDLSPGTQIDLSGEGKIDGTLVDSDGDGISDGINLTGGNTPNLILIDTNGDNLPDAVDSNGDGIPDYYISPNPPGFLTTAPGGSGNPVVLIVDANGNPLGFDTDGDGAANDTTIVTILSDTTPPTITSSLLTGTFSSTQTTTLSCTDNRAPGAIVYTLDVSNPSFIPKNGTIITKSSKDISLSTEGTHTLQAICRDLAGNISAPITLNYTIDIKVPALSIVSQTSDSVSANVGAINSSTITWISDRSGSFTIREGSSCESGVIISNGNVTANLGQSLALSHTHFTGEGYKSFRICVTGTNGLTGFVSLALRRDDTAPVVSASPGSGSYSTSTSVSLSCTDTGGSGCEQIAYAVQVGSAPSNPSLQGTTGAVISGVLYTSAILMSDASVTYTKFVARDKAGNVSAVSSQNYTVDTQVATITVNSNTVAINGTSNVSINWQSNQSGTYQIRVGGSNCSNGTALTQTGNNANVVGNVTASSAKTSTISNSHFSEGNNTIRICVANLVGNFGSTSITISKDTTAPLVTMTSPAGAGPFVSGVQLVLSCSDTSGSGCDKIIYTTNGSEPSFDSNGAVTNGIVYSSPVALANGSNQIKYLARDLAGNLSTTGSQIFQVGPPNPPAFVEAQASGTSALVQWWPVTGAETYTVYYSTSPGVTSASTSFGPVSDPNASITGLSSGTLYYFRVAVNNQLGTSALSLLEASALTTATPPGTSDTGIHVDISAGQSGNSAGSGSISGAIPSANLDIINNKLLVVTVNDANNGKPSLFRCELDGTNCTHSDLSAGEGTNSGRNPNAKIDFKNQKLLVVARNGANENKPSLYRCDLNGSNCTHTDISAGQGANSAGDSASHKYGPKLIIDDLNQKILVVTINDANNGKLSLFRCDLDGNNCNHTDISAGQGANSAFYPSFKVDTKNQKMLVVTYNNTKLSLFRCNLDGTNCTHTDISVGQSSLIFPSLNIDLNRQKMMVAVHKGNIGVGTSDGGKPGIVQCDLNGANCSYVDVSYNSSILTSHRYMSSSLDLINQKILIVYQDQNIQHKPRLTRCDFDGSNCNHKDISVGQGSYSGTFPETLINSANGKLFVVTQNGANGRRPSLFIW